jgi:K+-sensing histidine kinase KdpD
LLENAIQHAVSKISLEIEYTLVNKLIVTVKDDGPAVNKNESTSIFSLPDYFIQCDKGRG